MGDLPCCEVSDEVEGRPSAPAGGDFGPPSQQVISALIDEAAGIVRAAEERRSARRELRTLIETLEREADLAAAEEDYPGADWLRAHAKRLRRTAFGANGPAGPPIKTPERPEARPSREPALARLQEPTTPPAIPAVAHGDLAHWFNRFREVEQQLADDDDCRGPIRAALQLRAVVCGAHAYVIRVSDEPTSAKGAKQARELRTTVIQRLEALGHPWTVPNIAEPHLDARARAAVIRRLSDGYCRSALAYDLFSQEQDSHDAAPVLRVRRLTACCTTLLYLQRQLHDMRVADNLLDRIVEEVSPVAASVGVLPASFDTLQDEDPPFTTRALTELIELGRPADSPQPGAEDPRERAIRAIVEVAQSRRDFGDNPDRIEEDREAILPLLNEAARIGVPMSNKTIRDVLLERWLPLLEGHGNHSVLIREVKAELERRIKESKREDGRDEGDESAFSPSEDVERQAEELKRVLEGKTLLMLGGVPRVHTAPRLQEALGLADVQWPEAKKSDTPDKFEAQMRRADVIVIVKSYARHSVSHAASEICKETGAQHVILTAGYGLARIIAQLHAHFRTANMIPSSA